MKRFIEGENRSQSTLFPERLDDYIAEDNPVRAIEVFVDELDLDQLGFDGMQPESHRQARLPSGDAAEDLHLRLPQSDSIQPPPGAGNTAQCRVDLADWSSDARLQDNCRLPQGQRQGDPRRSVANSSCCAANSICSLKRSLPSMAASSRRSTTAIRTSLTPSSRSAWSSWRKVSDAISPSLTARTGRRRPSQKGGSLGSRKRLPPSRRKCSA
jgi:hypothetical protein